MGLCKSDASHRRSIDFTRTLTPAREWIISNNFQLYMHSCLSRFIISISSWCLFFLASFLFVSSMKSRAIKSNVNENLSMRGRECGSDRLNKSFSYLRRMDVYPDFLYGLLYRDKWTPWNVHELYQDPLKLHRWLFDNINLFIIWFSHLFTFWIWFIGCLFSFEITNNFFVQFYIFRNLTKRTSPNFRSARTPHFFQQQLAEESWTTLG